MTDDTRSRWELWPYREPWRRHHWVANNVQRMRRLALPGPSLTLVVQDEVYPARVQVTATNLTIGDVITISRSAAGSTTRVAIRGANEITAASTTLVLSDAEQPFGVELTYRLTIGETTEEQRDVAEATVTVTLVGGKVVLSDAIAGNAVEVVVLSWPSKRRTRPTSVFPVAGRNIVVSGTRGQFEGTIELFCETTAEVEAVNALLQSATSGVLQLRQAGPYDGVDCYFVTTSDDETRYSQDGSDERRVYALDVIETTAWTFTQSSGTYTLQDIADYYSGYTLATLAADYPTLLAIAGGSYET